MSLEIRIAEGSLTEGDELVLVNASNTNLQLGSGVSGAIRRACGAGYQARLRQVLEQRGGPLVPGEVVVTDAGEHPRARYVAHVAVMDYRQGFTQDSYPSLELIRTGCQRLWQVLESIPAESLSVAMVALGAGTGNLGLKDSVRVACESLQAHLASHPRTRLARLTFYGYELPEYLATAAEVVRHFPDAEGSLPPEARKYLQAVRQAE